MIQYSPLSQVPFVHPTDLGCTPTILAWKTPFDNKALICKHIEQRQQYDECHNVNTALRNQLLMKFEGMYLAPLKNVFMGYSRSTTPTLLSHLYGKYARISAINLADNSNKMKETCNPDDPLKILYTRLNKCVDCATAVGKPITEGQFV